jgi:hypothetical protein
MMNKKQILIKGIFLTMVGFTIEAASIVTFKNDTTMFDSGKFVTVYPNDALEFTIKTVDGTFSQKMPFQGSIDLDTIKKNTPLQLTVSVTQDWQTPIPMGNAQRYQATTGVLIPGKTYTIKVSGSSPGSYTLSIS